MKKICLKNLIISIIVFLSLLIILFFLNKQILSNFSIINDYILEKNQIKEKNNTIDSLNKSILEIQDNLILLNSHFVDNSKIIDFLEEIEKSALLVGAKAEVVSVKVPDDKNPNALIAVNINGSFESIYKFLILIENSNYELSVSSFNVSKSYINNGKDNITKWSGNFVIKIISFI